MIIVYDTEIARAIPPKGPCDKVDGVEYCSGWDDYAGMGIACICAQEMVTGLPYVFLQDNLKEFQYLVKAADLCIGYNNASFDNVLLQTHGIRVPFEKTWDLLQEIWAGAGLGSEYKKETHSGLSLDAMAKANDLPGKTGSGELAPILWQRGQHGKVISYCLHDIWLTAELVRKVECTGLLLNPKYPEDYRKYFEIKKLPQ